VPSLPGKKQKQIAEQIASNQETEQIIIRLHDLGFGPKLAMAIYQVYLGDTLNIVENKPYQLVYDVKGIGFNKADTLARNVGRSEEHTSELQSRFDLVCRLLLDKKNDAKLIDLQRNDGYV